jgi:hypothetical protein
MSSPLQLDEKLLRSVVDEVMRGLGRTSVAASSPAPVAAPAVVTAPRRDSRYGIFTDVGAACTAAHQAFQQLQQKGLAGRVRVIEIVKALCEKNAVEWGRIEFEETKIGRLAHKVEKLQIVKLVPGLEWLRPYACGDGPMKVVGGAFIDALVPAPVDAAGEPFYPVNAESGRWLRFDTEACAYGALAWPESPAGPGAPAGTQFPMGPARVTLTADVGAPLVAPVQAPGEIDAAEVVFAVAGFGGGPVPLTDGETLGDQGWGRTARRIFPSVLGLTSAGVPVCGAPPPEWFVFTAAPPEVCAPRPLATEGDIDPSVRYGLPGPYLGVSAYLVADGTCDLSLTAPAFAAGAGFEARLSATLLNVENMHDAP